jgi:hypothetical protein
MKLATVAPDSTLADGTVAARTAAPGARGAAHFVRWSPLIGAGALALQVLFLGLAPALWESLRLAREEERVGARWEALIAEHRALSLERHVQSDPIFVERERRALLARPEPR